MAMDVGIMEAGVGILLALLAAWRLLLCPLLRELRLRYIRTLDPVRDAYALTGLAIFVEFPKLVQTSIDFGLLRTFTIPSISRLLVKTGHLRNPDLALVSKRYDATDILFAELMAFHVDDGARGSTAVCRINYLHGLHPTIANHEFLYVLSVFVLLPIDFAARYGFRKWTEQEKLGYFNVWQNVGTRMGIHDIPSTIDALKTFQEEYETKYMVYADTNREVAESTMALVLSDFPHLLHPLVRRVAYVVMGNRMCKALGYPEQPCWIVILVHSLLCFIFQTCQMWLPPRPQSWPKVRVPISCPFLDEKGQMCDVENAVLKLAYQAHKPVAYPHGYKIKDLGSVNPGKLGKAFDGKIPCPFMESSI